MEKKRLHLLLVQKKIYLNVLDAEKVGMLLNLLSLKKIYLALMH
ncbi:Uncharacterised protein [Chlamydia trachomatis]|nr:Uncharacterised protein [Chlamydia trachomatis]